MLIHLKVLSLNLKWLPSWIIELNNPCCHQAPHAMKTISLYWETRKTQSRGGLMFNSIHAMSTELRLNEPLHYRFTS